MENKRVGGKGKGILFLLGGLLIGLLLGVVIFALIGRAQQSGRPAAPPTVGAQAPDFTLPVLGGGAEQKLSDLRGAPVLLNFWATWCLPCRDEMPLLEKTAAEYRGRLLVLGVNAGEEPEQVQPFVDETGVTFPILLDRDQSVRDAYFARNFPMTLFLDQEGVIRGIHLGVLNEAQLRRYLATIGLNP